MKRALLLVLAAGCAGGAGPAPSPSVFAPGVGPTAFVIIARSTSSVSAAPRRISSSRRGSRVKRVCTKTPSRYFFTAYVRRRLPQTSTASIVPPCSVMRCAIRSVIAFSASASRSGRTMYTRSYLFTSTLRGASSS
jgi:hypothetical protein